MRVTLVRRSLLLVLVLVGALLAVPAAEAADKPWSLTITPAPPATVVAAGTSATFTATFAVPSTAQQELGSANLTVPAGFTLVSGSILDPHPPLATATRVGNTLELRQLAVRPGGSLTVSVTALVPCSPDTTATWTVQAKQSNDFRGTGNDLNDLNALGRAPTTSIGAGPCATKTCQVNADCSLTSPSGQSTLTINVIGGVEAGKPVQLAFGTLGTAGIIDCRISKATDYVELTQDEATYGYNGAGAKVATYRIDKTAVAAVPNNGVTSLQLCYGSPETFTPRPGTLPTVQQGVFDWDGNGVLKPVFVGLLPDCPAGSTTPCISKRQKNQAGDGIITVQIPANTPGDPKMAG